MNYRPGQILKYQNSEGKWFLLKVTIDGGGVVIETHHPSRYVGESGPEGFWSFNESYDARSWSVHKEWSIKRLLNKIDGKE